MGPKWMNKSAKIKSAEEILESKRGGMDYRVPTLDGDYKLGLSSLTRIAKMALGYRVQFPLAIAAVIIAAMSPGQMIAPRA